MNLTGRFLKMCFVAVLSIQMVSCGTILYPERRGQKQGRIDTGVAILDGVGLLFFLIPGVVAYAVDFNTGAIYLPEKRSGVSSDLDGIMEVRFEPKTLTSEKLRDIIREKAGYDVDLDDPRLKVLSLESRDEMMEAFRSELAN